MHYSPRVDRIAGEGAAAWRGSELVTTFSLPRFNETFDVKAGVLREADHRAELAVAVTALEVAVSQ